MEVEVVRQSLVATENPFGALKSARLEVNAPLLPVKDISEGKKVEPLLQSIPFSGNMTGYRNLQVRGLEPFFFLHPSVGMNTPAGRNDLKARITLGLIFNLPVALASGRSDLRARGDSYGLLVQKVESSERDYKQIGRYRCLDPAPNPIFIPPPCPIGFKRSNRKSITLIQIQQLPPLSPGLQAPKNQPLWYCQEAEWT